MQMLNSTNNCYLKVESSIFMTKKAITWIREDFRVENNPALSYATQNHEMYLPYTFITKMIMTIKERLKNGGFQNL